jgi:type VI secretion system secreted protein Hcp
MTMKRRSLSKPLMTGVMIAGLLASTSVMAADMFLKMDGIVGESLDARHPGEIDVLSWSWGESTGTARSHRGLLPSACVHDFSFTKQIDSSSAALITNGVTGDVVPTAVLAVRKSGGLQQEFLRITMRNVIVVSYQTGGAAADARLLETVVLHFDSMQGQYRKQRADGSLEPPITWEINATNSAGCQ